MVGSEAVSLRLRFREAGGPLEPPDVDAFARAPRSESADCRLESLGVLPGGRLHESQAPLVVFMQSAAYGVPPIGPVSDEVDVSSWCIRPTLFGHVASVHARRGRAPSRVAWVAAACLPLVLPAWAQAAPADPTIQRPATRSGPPELPAEGDPGESQPEAPPEGLDASAEDSSITPPQQPERETIAPPAPPSLGPEPNGPFDAATVDAAWEGVDGSNVELELKGGTQMSGRVGAVQRDTFTLIDGEDGTVVVLSKSDVVSLRVRVPTPIPSKSGGGLIAGGTALTIVAAPVFITGVTFLAICPSCTYIHLPMLLIGGAGLGGGIPMLVRGTRRRDAFQKAVAEHQVALGVGRSQAGWTGGLRFRF